MRLVRGSGWPGLGGMKAVEPARRLLRPLLGTPRAELEAFLRSLGVDWIEDASNRSDAFRRNRMRNHVIPLLKAENPSFSRSTRTLWELAREDEHYWNEVLAPVFAQLREENGSLLLPRAAFVSLPRAAAPARICRFVPPLRARTGAVRNAVPLGWSRRLLPQPEGFSIPRRRMHNDGW